MTLKELNDSCHKTWKRSCVLNSLENLICDWMGTVESLVKCYLIMRGGKLINRHECLLLIYNHLKNWYFLEICLGKHCTFYNK